MTWLTRRDALYTHGTTAYRITPYTAAGWYLLDVWNNDYKGWQMLGRTATLEAAQQFAECEEIFQAVGAT